MTGVADTAFAGDPVEFGDEGLCAAHALGTVLL
ncbi:hypothetical protein GA0115255_117611, partial [Streptomyces sp. Ncost-T6T-2b]